MKSYEYFFFLFQLLVNMFVRLHTHLITSQIPRADKGASQLQFT